MSPTEGLSGVRAIICDVYGTLLQVGPPPEDAARLWESGCRILTGGWMPLDEFNARCAAIVAAENAQRRLSGEPFPDVNWLVLLEKLWARRLDPVYARVSMEGLSELHARCVRTCSATRGAITTLAALRELGLRLGLASNAQHYTWRELRAAGLPPGDFDPELCFLSGEHGFAKPSPRVFAHLAEKLAALGIAPHESLMVGDSLENDITPAAAAGWRTWHLGPRTWEELNDEIRRSKPGMTKSE